MRITAHEMVIDAIGFTVVNDDSYDDSPVRVVGNWLGEEFDLEEELETSDIWDYAISVYGDDIPELFLDFMEKTYGETYYAWNVSDEFADELRSIIDDAERKDQLWAKKPAV